MVFLLTCSVSTYFFFGFGIYAIDIVKVEIWPKTRSVMDSAFSTTTLVTVGSQVRILKEAAALERLD